MIVTLTSLVGNWQRELERFAPSLRVAVHHGAGSPRRGSTSSPRTTSSITTYPLVARDQRASSPRSRSTCSCSTRRTRSRTRRAGRARPCAALDARHRVCLSGTPIENHLGELWSLFDFLMPGPARRRATSSRRSSACRSRSKGDKVRLEALRDRVRAVHPAPHQGRGRAGAAGEDAARARGRADRRAARALREHPRRRARRGPPAHPRSAGSPARRSRSSTRCSSCARCAAIRGWCRSTRRARSAAARSSSVLLELVDAAARRRAPHPGVLAVRAHARPDLARALLARGIGHVDADRATRRIARSRSTRSRAAAPTCS